MQEFWTQWPERRVHMTYIGSGLLNTCWWRLQVWCHFSLISFFFSLLVELGREVRDRFYKQNGSWCLFSIILVVIVALRLFFLFSQRDSLERSVLSLSENTRTQLKFWVGLLACWNLVYENSLTTASPFFYYKNCASHSVFQEKPVLNFEDIFLLENTLFKCMSHYSHKQRMHLNNMLCARDTSQTMQPVKARIVKHWFKTTLELNFNGLKAKLTNIWTDRCSLISFWFLLLS